MKATLSPNMTRLCRWMDVLKPALYLEGYEIGLSLLDEDEEDEAGRFRAEILCSNANRYCSATIKFYPHYFELDLRSQWETLVHELLHLFIDPVSELSKRQRSGGLVTTEEQTNVVERAVTNVQRAVTRNLPMPDEPKTKRRKR